MPKAYRAWLLIVGIALANPATSMAQAAPTPQPTTEIPARLKALRDAIAAMRGNDSLTANDQSTIREWLQAELDLYPEPAADSPDFMTSVSTFLKSFRSEIQRQIGGGKPVFLTQTAAQAAAICIDVFPRSDLSLLDGMALGTLLLDFRRIETVPGLKAGLSSRLPVVRYQSALGLRELQAELVSANLLADVAAALRNAGVKEESRDVRGAIYQALSVPNQVGAVFDAWLTILTARADEARKTRGLPGKDCTIPLLYFISEAPRLTTQQTEAIVRPLAVLLRVWAEAYQASSVLSYEDEVATEAALYKTEELFQILTRTPGGIRKALEEKDATLKDRLLSAAQAWYGATDTPGVLNGDPWKVEVGAP